MKPVSTNPEMTPDFDSVPMTRLTLNQDMVWLLLKKHGISTIAELCIRLDYTRPSVTRFLRGEAMVPEILERLAYILGVHPVMLLDGPVRLPGWVQEYMRFMRGGELTPLRDNDDGTMMESDDR